MTTRREIIKMVFDGEMPPYVPWQMGLTLEAREKLLAHYGVDDLTPVLQNHYTGLGSGVGFFHDLGDDRLRDVFGVIWNRKIDKDIGDVENCMLPEPTLAGYTFPDPEDERVFASIPDKLAEQPDNFRVFSIGFSLWERAWTLRGMTNLMMDFYDHPAFVRELLHTIGEYNIAQVRKALTYDIDCIHFGDDWGMQRGIQMGVPLWREFIYPVLKEMYGVAKAAGKYVSIHSCGDVDEVFDDLVNIGLDCFNPFQPEVMDVAELMGRYRGRLAFHGGMSTQKTLPFGSVQDVRDETTWLLELGREGGHIFAPAHGVEGDVPLENMLAFIEIVQAQPGYVELFGASP